MKHIYSLLMALILLSVASCNIDEIADPNGPSVTGFQQNATKGALQTLVTGVEDKARREVGFYYDVTSIIGRDYYYFTGSDPRYTGEVLGKGSAVLDNAGFYGTRPYAGRYGTVKTANILMESANSSELITDTERKGYLGFAKTMQAMEFLLVLNLQYENGIRMDVSDPDNLGPFLSYTDALSGIQSLLNDANSDLSAAGSDFSFNLSSGFAGFDTPASFASFNRAIAARVALYQGNKSEALSLLNGSFMDLMGSLDNGPARFYSSSGGDLPNPVFRTPNQADAIIAHPGFITDAIDGDNRLSKVAKRDETARLDGLEGDYDVVEYQSLNDYIPFIVNEELILIYAEANIGTDNGAAVEAINVIRNAAGIGNYTGGQSDAELLDEVLFERRYSLFGQGHRWVDMRRLGKLDELPLDRDGDDVWVQFPRPVSENG